MFSRRPALGARALDAPRACPSRDDVDVVAQLVELVLRRHQPVEHLHARRARDRDGRPRCRHGRRRPRAPCRRGPWRRRRRWRAWSSFDRDLRRHAAHGEGAAAVAGLDEQQRIGGEESLDPSTMAERSGVRKLGLFAEPLDEGEDVVPAAAIEADDVVAHFVEDFVHLEGGRQRLDQDRRLERPRAARRARSSAWVKTSFQSRASRWLSSLGR